MKSELAAKDDEDHWIISSVQFEVLCGLPSSTSNT